MKIKIVYFHVTGDLYGSSRSLLSIIKGLEKEKFEPIVVLPEEGDLVDELEALGATVWIRKDLLILRRQTFKSLVSLLLFVSYFCLALPRLYRQLKHEKVSLVHSNSAIVMSGAIVAKLLAIPHIWHMREVFDDFPKLLWRMYRYLIMRLSSKVICISTDVRKRFAPYQQQDKLVTVFNGIEEDYPFFPGQRNARADLRAQWGIPQEAVIIGNVARISTWKGQDVLIQSFAASSKARDTYLVLAGDCYPGNEYVLRALEQLVKELHVQDRVIFAGFMKDSRQVYAAIDIFVLASTTPEPFGRVLIEAMYCGLPSIATNWGGPVDIITDGVDGLLVAANKEEMRRGLESLLADEERRKQLGVAATESIRTKFLAHHTVHAIKLEYQNLLAVNKANQEKRQIFVS
ncbi:glycosyltransferase [Paenibacillus roseipurpureus]|uniref:Glycosyltransferase n=1 Tax=Paenibacillus roseopurpureus TaxID=2918901 RepID=A0AA96LNG6_9BACL|nr:glycosyltransferase [Paenibacillus sp. MBLB1832]WNR43766.1 glycosyltransferase [Paenibacillus sp. MBLB1832]